MSDRSIHLLVQSSPFLRQGVTTPRLMFDVHLALIPVVLASVWTFGLSALLVIAAATAGAALTERFMGGGAKSLLDGSGALTGVILGLTLPPGLPLWMAFLGGVVAIGLGKLVWGGLGNNLFNPALVGRAFLQAAFPTSLTTWSPPGDLLAVRMSNFAVPFLKADVDAVTTATPLGLMKFQNESTELLALFGGSIAGSLGETSALIILIVGIWMAVRRVFDWRIPASILLTVAAVSGVIYAVDPSSFPSPLFMLGSGGLLFGAVFMATDPVTSPLTPKGAWIFGFGIGVLVVLIRIWGGLPEGVMYAILLMNAATPLIERYTQRRVFGQGGRS